MQNNFCFFIKLTVCNSILAAEVNNEIEEEKREDVSEISNIFGSKQTHKHSCLKCADDVKKESVVLACNLVITLRIKTFLN